MQGTVAVARKFTRSGEDVWSGVEMVTRDVRLGKFEQLGVEVPKAWSQNATNIVAQKYFRGKMGTSERESSARQMIDRVATTITAWGAEQGYFSGDDTVTFHDELTYILVNQMAAFNSPVWFNVGFEESPQCSACFILSCEDTFEGPNGISAWQDKEMKIFLGGSGSGVSLSKLRGSMEQLSKGGMASGPVSFMRGADAWAGTIKSGGKTRRAAKMVILSIDHPDIFEFIWCKAKEERKAQVLAAAGYSGGMEGDVLQSIQYQNANNSVRLTDDFMRAVEEDAEWKLIARTTGRSIGDPIPARALFDAIAEASWQCADPGVQFDTTINDWHTCPESGRINASNPCSEYMHVDDSACNLASLNLMKFRQSDGTLAVGAFRHTVEVMLTAQDILIDRSSYPTEQIAVNARAFRQLGLGYANLGAYLMSIGHPYDSDEGRTAAARITALMHGRAYMHSARMAETMGAYDEFERNRNPHLQVVAKHLDAYQHLGRIDTPLDAAAHDDLWHALELGNHFGYRNAQVTVLAPTGTISFLMDCDTTGVEPDFALVKHKELVGGGSMELINQSVTLALASLEYPQADIGQMVQEISSKGDAVGVVRDEHLAVFDTAQTIAPMGHVRMMAAVQPFISGAISKTINMPHDATQQDIKDVIMEAWRTGVKSLAVYREGSKGTQALSTKPAAPAVDMRPTEAIPPRRRLPDTRQSITHKCSIDGHEGYITMGMHDDGTLGEVFVTGFGKDGSTIAGLINWGATLTSLALQYGVPLEDLARKFRNMRFEPQGRTMNPQIPTTTSLPDYIHRVMAAHFADTDLQEELGVLTDAVRRRMMDDAVVEAEHVVEPVVKHMDDVCRGCGGLMVPTGMCKTCSSCGETGGCG
jgi:ribonucleoside-diphosphate reductase alpha chain